ncbi:MAG: hypothetical protein DBX39_01165 [Bacillota bacterium]|nr:MAG: hypothetical protein DBX39_01165 [Bacillota bacterium]
MQGMELFYLIISCVFIVLLAAAIVMWVIDGQMEAKRRAAISDRIKSGKGLRLENDDLILKVQDGKIIICDSMPQVAEAKAAVAEEDTSVLQPMKDEMAAAAGDDAYKSEKLDELQELVDRYGELTDKSIVFESNKQEKVTFIDKYAELSSEARTRYDSIVAYILANPDCKKVEASNAVTFKCKTDKIVRVMIKRGVVILNFLLANTDLNRFVREEGIKTIKINPVVIKLETDSDLVLAKQTADITIENIREEQQYRKERNRELRRQRYRQKEDQTAEAEEA